MRQQADRPLFKYLGSIYAPHFGKRFCQYPSLTSKFIFPIKINNLSQKNK